MKFHDHITHAIIHICSDHPVHGSFFSEKSGKRSCVDSRNSSHAFFYKQGVQLLLTPEIARHIFQFSDYQTVCPDASGFPIRRHPVVSDQRIRQHHHLPRIGRICQHLQISRHRRIKHNLAYRFLFCTNLRSFKYSAIL